MSGLEFLSGIFGFVGGVVYMNVGVYGFDMFYVVEKVFILFEDGIFEWLINEEF